MALNAMHPPPQSAYVHVPFCRHRCGYCNFTLIAGRDDLVAAYLAALSRELQLLEVPRTVDTLFFGGGTPTHLSPHDLDALLRLARQWFPPSPGAEISSEANPLDLTKERCGILRAHGVNRISLGVQSFSDRKLKILERDHTAGEIEQAVQHAQRTVGPAGSVSIDLIFGVPGETAQEWRRDLDQAVALSPTHLSTYGLTFEKGTQFWNRLARGDLAALPEEEERAHYEMAIDVLEGAGFEHYEVSNFARPGHRCRHNEAYWDAKPYFAAGPGAARYVEGRREVNHRSTTTWLRRLAAEESPVAESEQLDDEDRARERLVIGLRRMRGVKGEEFLLQTGRTIESLVGEALMPLIAQGLMEWNDGALRLTRAGLLVSDSIWPRFLRR